MREKNNKDRECQAITGIVFGLPKNQIITEEAVRLAQCLLRNSFAAIQTASHVADTFKLGHCIDEQ